ncbi:MAG: class I SAM-dependent methyltransferase [DPANN group archaeon]|nr:class I SAM-dependent methyltransferase [DPANN group archaeon]
MKSPLYASPWIYEFILNIIHGKERNKRFDFIAQQVRGNSVVDLACGSAKLASHLKNQDYRGYDLNKKFISDGKKRGLNVILKNVLDKDIPKADTVVIIDALHHMPSKKYDLMGQANRIAKKRVIAVEPYDTGGFLERFNHVLDADGINDHEDWLSKDELREFYKEFNGKIIEENGYMYLILDK